MIFVPHTNNSELANELKAKETELCKITGDRIKIVERSGTKLENILGGTDPWKGLDCKRENCLLCNKKTLTGKNLKHDFKKENILYEIRCLICKEKERERITEECGENLEKAKELLSRMTIPKYIGETSRSAYE